MLARMRLVGISLCVALVACGGFVEERSDGTTDGGEAVVDDAGRGDSLAADARPTDAGPTTCPPGPDGAGGMGAECVPVSELESAAKDACKSGIASLTFTRPCAGKYRIVHFKCCTPDGACTESPSERGECKTVSDWESIADFYCAKLGGERDAVSVSEPCSSDATSRGYDVKCCAPGS